MQVLIIKNYEEKEQPTTKQSPIQKNTNFSTINRALQPETFYIPGSVLYDASAASDIFTDILEFLDDEDNQFKEKDKEVIESYIYKIKEAIDTLDTFVVENVIEE